MLVHNGFIGTAFRLNVAFHSNCALWVQMTYLEEWALMDWDYLSSLLGATEALKASTLRLPVVGRAKVSTNMLAVQKTGMFVAW